MKSLFIAIGNPLRRDDEVAQAVVALLPGAEYRVVHQLVPELADVISTYEVVVFIDADVDAAAINIEPLVPGAPANGISHAMSPMRIVALSRQLFGFTGQAYLCRVPVEDLSAGEGLSLTAAANARKAAEQLCRLP